MENKIQFRDLNRQYEAIKDKIDTGIQEVIANADFISGGKVKELEEKLADYAGVKHCITCANGTDAITIALKAMGLSGSDAAFVPDFTFFSSGECPASLGLPTYFVDVRKDTYNMDPDALVEAIECVRSEGTHRPGVLIAVDLFGQPAEHDRLKEICKRYGMYLLEDGAQGLGGRIGHRMACSFGDIATTSFFPAKPLGCYGDGGAIFTDCDEWAELCRSLAVHGKDMGNPDDPDAKYNNVRLGFNSRLDTLQAAVLLAKLDAFKDSELDAVNRVAKWYGEILSDSELVLPTVKPDYYSSWAQYTVQLPECVDRDGVQKKMKEAGIPAMVYYRKPMHKQRAFANTASAIADCPVTERLCETVLCLPIHPYLRREEAERVCDKLLEACESSARIIG